VLDLFGRKEFVHNIDARPPADEVQAEIRRILGLPAYQKPIPQPAQPAASRG
jgi:adenylate kinase